MFLHYCGEIVGCLMKAMIVSLILRNLKIKDYIKMKYDTELLFWIEKRKTIYETLLDLAKSGTYFSMSTITNKSKIKNQFKISLLLEPSRRNLLQQ